MIVGMQLSFMLIKFQRLNFKELFDPKECVSKNNENGELNFHQTGGRIINLNKNNILLTVGDYRYRKLAQQNIVILVKL